MPAGLHALTHGTRGLELLYVAVLVGMLIGLARVGAGRGRFLRAPLFAIPTALLAVIVVSLASPLLRALGLDREGYAQFGFALVVFVGTGYGVGRFLKAARRSPQHQRGALIKRSQPDSALRGRLWSRLFGRTLPNKTGITLAGIAIPLEDETKHFKLIGTTGTGKSTAIREMLGAALSRGDRAIIADPDGGYTRRFHDATRGDVILNPFDPNALKWDLFGEIVHDYDIDHLAHSLITDSGDPDRTWTEYARTFFTTVTRQCVNAGTRDDTELFRLITAASEQELRILLAGTSAGPFLEEGNERMFGSVRAITASAVRALEYTTRQQATPFSVRDWVRNGAARPSGPGGVVFLPYSAGQIAALRSVISAWMRLAIFEAMEHPEGDQRLWFVVDELDALGQIDGLKDALARLRKFGGRCILGFQSIAQVSATYGKGSAETVVENCGNTLVLRCSASEHGGTSEFASRLIGQREVIHLSRSQTWGRKGWFSPSTTTTSEHLKIEPAVMASEIERLADLAGFLKPASCPDWHCVQLIPGSEPAWRVHAGSTVGTIF